MILGKRKVGVIGLGLIGSRVVSCLRKAGHATYVWSRTPRPAPNFLGSIESLAAQCQVIQIFVSDDRALEVCAAALVKCVGGKHVILNHATVSPEAAERAAAVIGPTGAAFLNAPFTGSKQAAEDGQLVYYVGGEVSKLESVRVVLEASSKKILHVGSVKDAALIKIATNLISATTVQVLAEALTLCRKHGVADEAFAEALEWNGARSGVTDLKLPKMIARDFSPHFELRHMLKDTGFGIDLAEKAGIELPATSATTACLLARVVAGEGSLDFAALIKNFDEAPARRTLPAAANAKDEPPAEPQEMRPVHTGAGGRSPAVPSTTEVQVESPRVVADAAHAEGMSREAARPIFKLADLRKEAAKAGESSPLPSGVTVGLAEADQAASTRPDAGSGEATKPMREHASGGDARLAMAPALPNAEESSAEPNPPAASTREGLPTTDPQAENAPTSPQKSPPSEQVTNISEPQTQTPAASEFQPEFEKEKPPTDEQELQPAAVQEALETETKPVFAAGPEKMSEPRPRPEGRQEMVASRKPPVVRQSGQVASVLGGRGVFRPRR